MDQNNILIGVIMQESQTLSLTDICDLYHIPQALLLEMLEQGLFSNQPEDAQEVCFNYQDLRRMESAFRLHKDLGVNLPGVVLALELLDKMDSLEQELEVLRRHV